MARGKLDAAHPLARLLDARLLLESGRSDRARPILEAFFAAGGEDFDARLVQAQALQRDGKKAEFVAALEKARACWPTSPVPLEQLRRHYMAEGREAEALAMLEEQARLASRSVPIRLELARQYGARGRDADALRVVEEALRITPFIREVHEAAVPICRKLGEAKKAVRSARCLVELRGEKDSDEEVADRWLTLAETLLEDGQAKEAEAAVREAERLAPDEQADRRAELKKKLGQ
jgi:tetratricopeptide (TPR) repeat protein